MNQNVNFKVPDCTGDMQHCFFIAVECHKFGDEFKYSVEARAYRTAVPVYLKTQISTPEEAFKYVERVVAAYPRYEDDRDSNTDLAPIFEDPDRLL